MAPQGPWRDGKAHASRLLSVSSANKRTCRGSPASVPHEGFQVQIHRDIFGRCDRDADGAGKAVNAGVYHVAFT